MKIFSFLLMLLTVAVLLATAPPAFAQSVDNAIYAELLQEHLHNGRVDYKGLKRDEARLDQYLAVLKTVNAAALSNKERFAFYVNVYNAWTLKLILMNYPGIESIKDAGSLFKSPWKIKFVELREGVLTLDNVEHDILRARPNDPRVHFAVNCASKSCPPLMSAPYEGSKLDAQLDAMTRAFINDPASNAIKGDTLYLSKIFDWFDEDFGGEKGVVEFVKQYAAPKLKQALERRSNLDVKYLDYDWTLNGE